MLRVSKTPGAKATALAHAAYAKGIDFYYFCPENVDISKNKIKAKHFANSAWVERYIDYPALIDNDRHSLKFPQLLQSLAAQCSLSFTETTHKINLMHHIAQQPQLALNTIPSVEAKRLDQSGFDGFLQFLKTHHDILIKAKKGFNQAVIYNLIEKEQGYVLFSSRTQASRLDITGLDQLKDFYTTFIQGHQYCLERNVQFQSMSKSGYAFYMRMYWQKNSDDSWVEVKKYIKVATAAHIDQQLRYDATIDDLNAFLKSNYPQNSDTILSEMQAIAHTLSQSLQAEYAQNISCFGLDLVIDADAKVWILRAIKYPDAQQFEFELAQKKMNYFSARLGFNPTQPPPRYHCADLDDFLKYADKFNFNQYRFFVDNIKPRSKGIFILTELNGKCGARLKTITEHLDKAAFIIAPISRNIDDVVGNIPVIYVESVEAVFFAYAQHVQKQYQGQIFSVVGSAGKTTTSKLLHEALIHCGESAYLNLRGNTPYYIASGLINLALEKHNAVFEVAGARLIHKIPIGQFSNQLVQPQVCIFTTLAPAHIEVIGTFEDLVRRKAAVFKDLPVAAKAIINRDIEHYDLLFSLIPAHVQVFTYGEHQDANFKLIGYDPNQMHLDLAGQKISIDVNNQPIELQKNFLAIIAALALTAKNWTKAVDVFKHWIPPKGRGKTTVLNMNATTVKIIDDAYNANPASMKLAIKKLSTTEHRGRKIIVLSEMAELGDDNLAYHQELLAPLSTSQIDKIILIGEKYKNVWTGLPVDKQYHYFDTMSDFEQQFNYLVQQDDLILFKGSNGTGLYHFVEQLVVRYAK